MITIIAEKPSVAREIASVVGAKSKKNGYLEGNGYWVTWAFGHLIGLADAKEYGYSGSWAETPLPLIPDSFITAPIILKDKKSNDLYEKQLETISGLFKKSKSIIVATDAGREGELIFRYIYEYLQRKDHITTPFDRLWISSLTDKAIKEGLSNIKSGKEYDKLAQSAKARSEADWLIGINGTRATTLNVNDRSIWSVGRVQTPTLCMVCKRYLENKNFKSTPYFTLRIRSNKCNLDFWASNPTRFEKEEDVVEICKRIGESDKCIVQDVQKKPSYSNPPLLYDLTTLQKDANSKFGMAADMTLKICQSLYEKKLTTYPRTGSRYIPDDVYDTLPKLIANAEKYPRFADYARKIKGKPLGRISVNASKVTDHHALLPTEYVPKDGQMTEAEKKIYELIVGRMLETVSGREEKDVTTIVLEVPSCKEIPFTAKGAVIRSYGWREVMKEKPKTNEDENEVLPMVVKGEELALKELSKEDKMTKAPPLLTENTLLGLMETAGKELENEEEREAMKDIGLGTPATRAETIEKLLAVQYIVRDKKQLIPTKKGLALYDIVKGMDIANVEMTGKWENVLNKIGNGTVPVDVFNEEIRKYTRKCTSELLKGKIDTSGIKRPLAHINMEMECPKCGSKFLVSEKICRCSNKEGCGFFFWRVVCQRRLTEKDIRDILNEGSTHGPVSLKKKDGSIFRAILVLGTDGNFTFKK